MELQNENLAKGLRMMYQGNVAALVSLVATLLCILVPPLAIITLIAALVAGVVSLMGLVNLRKEHEDYQKALIAVAAGLICGLFSQGESGFAQLMSNLQAVAGCCQIYFVVRATNSLLRARGLEDEVHKGDRAWKWELISVVASIAVGVIAALLIRLLSGGGAVISIVLLIATLIISIYATILYLGYLNASSKAVG